MTEKEEKKPVLRLLRGLGVEDFLSGLGDFLSNVEQLAEKGEALERGKTFEGKRYKGEYRYRISTIGKEAPRKVGIGIRPGMRYERPRYKPPSVEKPRIVEPEAEAKEPLVDCFDKNDHILVVASLPNIKEEDLELNIGDNMLKITAKTLKGEIEKEISIPKGSRVDKISSVSFKHGILEIKLTKKKKREYGKRK